MTEEELVQRYPRLWHMADLRNAPGIFDRGLLCTSELLRLFEIRGDARRALEQQRRPESVTLSASGLGVAVIRDQQPLSVPRIAASLTTGSVTDFLRFINARVFFWPTERRLITMNSAEAYRETPQLVFVVETASLVPAHRRRIRLSPINSGATRPFAHERSIDMFRSITEFDYEARKRYRDPIAELTVARGVPEIFDHVIGLEVWQNGTRLGTLKGPYKRAAVVTALAELGGPTA
ncbi:MAG: hypothetical protein WA324_07935 [Bryobacteraceae bacterium]